MSEMTEICRFNAHLYVAAKRFAGRHDVRWYMNGVCIERSGEGGCLLIATDGRRLVCLHDVSGAADPGFEHQIILPRLKLKGVKLKSMRRTRTARVLTSASKFPEATIEILDEDGNLLATQVTKLIEGKFVDWRGVIPESVDVSEVVAAAFNPNYLKDFTVVARGYGLLPSSLFIVYPRGEWNALVTWERCPAVGAIMPLQNHGAANYRAGFVAPCIE